MKQNNKNHNKNTYIKHIKFLRKKEKNALFRLYHNTPYDLPAPYGWRHKQTQETKIKSLHCRIFQKQRRIDTAKGGRGYQGLHHEAKQQREDFER